MRFLFRLLLLRRWGWLVVGAILLAAGGLVFAAAQPVQPVEKDGTIAHFKEWTKADGTYDHNEIDLNGDTNAYTFNKYDFNPSLPTQVYKEGKVSIWVDQGTTNVVAMTLYDQHDENPTKYTTDVYVHPDDAVLNDHRTGGILAGIGGVFLLIGLLWPLFPFGRKKPAPNRVQERPGKGTHQPPSPGYGPPPGFGTPPSYGPQQGYGPQQQYGPPPQ